MLETLTPRQDAFCQAFALGGSAAAAARAAGYAPESARTQAWRLLQRRAVQLRLNELRRTAEAAETAFAARLFARAEALYAAAETDGDHGLALRVLQTQVRLFRTFGAPTATVLEDDAALDDRELAEMVGMDVDAIALRADVDIGPDVRAAATRARRAETARVHGLAPPAGHADVDIRQHASAAPLSGTPPRAMTRREKLPAFAEDAHGAPNTGTAGWGSGDIVKALRTGHPKALEPARTAEERPPELCPN